MPDRHHTTFVSRSRTQRSVLTATIGLVSIVAAGCGGGSTSSGSSSGGDEIRDRYRLEVIDCVQNRGFAEYQGEFSENDLAEGAPVVAAATECEQQLSALPEYSDFQNQAGEDEVADHADRVAEAWSVWKCVEESDYVRLTPIPLVGPKGRPLLPSIRNFDVAEDEKSIETFYRTAATCGDGDLDRYRFEGRFLGMDDLVACNEENIGTAGYDDVTGCYNVDEYPTDT